MNVEMEELSNDINKQPELFRRHKQDVLKIPQNIAEAVCGHDVVLTGIATSLYALEGAFSILNMQHQVTHQLINTCDLLDYSYPQEKDMRPLIVVSRSGESAETVRLIKGIDRDRIVIGITEGHSGPLAERAGVCLGFCANEQAFPNTASFTLSQIYGLAVMWGLGFKSKKPLNELLDELYNCSVEVLSHEKAGEEIGALIASAQGVLLEGQGCLAGVANQYALDLHESGTLGISVTGGIMRHGVMELTRRADVVTLMLIPDDNTAFRKIGLAEELCAQGSSVAVLTNCIHPISVSVPVFRLPKCPIELSSILFTLGMQKIYESYIIRKGLKSLRPSLVGKITRRE